jgi:hypothetical protein
MNQEKVILFQARDFGETFSAAIKFIKQNFKAFFKAQLFVAGPFILFAAIAGAYYQANMLTVVAGRNMLGGFSSILGWPYLIYILAMVLSHLSVLGTTYAYMVAYHNNKGENVEVAQVSKILLKNSMKIIGGFFLVLILVVIIGFAAAFIIGLIGSIHIIMAIIMGIVTVGGLLIIIPPFSWQFTTYYLYMMHNDDSVINSLSRIREIMRGEFWWTWLIVICTGIAVGILAVVFAIPQLIYQMILTFTAASGNSDGELSIPFMVVVTIGTILVTLTYSLYYIVFAMHYYSLIEKKEGIGLMERINEIGSKPGNDNINTQY